MTPRALRALRARRDEARLALLLLTRLPAGHLADPAPALARARWAFPLVGLVTGAVAWAAQAVALALGLGSAPAAVLALAALAAVTGALHLDGLADFADGIGGGRDRAQCLEIMRDSRIGSYGVLALILALALGGGALAAFRHGAPLAVWLFAATASRLAMLLVLDLLPPARTDGLGHMAAGASAGAWVPGAAVTLALGLVVGPGVAVAALVMAGAAGAVAGCARRRIGGQTGDVLGAAQTLAEIAGLLALSAWLAA